MGYHNSHIGTNWEFSMNLMCAVVYNSANLVLSLTCRRCYYETLNPYWNGLDKEPLSISILKVRFNEQSLLTSRYPLDKTFNLYL